VAWAVHDLTRVGELERMGVTGIILDDLDLIVRAGPSAARRAFDEEFGLRPPMPQPARIRSSHDWQPCPPNP
jgi:hypothetical protein